MFRALIAARRPKSTTTTQAPLIDPESTTTNEDTQPRSNIQASVENVNYIPQAEVASINVYLKFFGYYLTISIEYHLIFISCFKTGHWSSASVRRSRFDCRGYSWNIDPRLSSVYWISPRVTAKSTISSRSIHTTRSLYTCRGISWQSIWSISITLQNQLVYEMYDAVCSWFDFIGYSTRTNWIGRQL